MLLPLYTIYPFWKEKTRKKPLPSSSNPILQLSPEIDNIIGMNERNAKKTENGQRSKSIRQQATGNRQQATGNRQQATGNRQLYTSFK